MLPDNKPFAGYNNGSEMWRDNALTYGIDEAINISRSYLDMSLKRELSEDEKQFCRDLFFTMITATKDIIEPAKLVYPHDFKTADDRVEAGYYLASRKLNTECARGIDRIINASCYKSNFFNLEIAAMRAIQDYGFNRVCLVLAFNIQRKGSDGRISQANRRWIDRFVVQEQAFNDTWLQSHATLVDGFCDYIREMYADLGGENFSLPGRVESGEYVRGYEITRSIMVDENQGYAIAHNPNAVDEYVCWQFYVRDGGRSYNWGIYGNQEAAVDAFNARVFVALNEVVD